MIVISSNVCFLFARMLQMPLNYYVHEQSNLGRAEISDTSILQTTYYIIFDKFCNLLKDNAKWMHKTTSCCCQDLGFTIYLYSYTCHP